MENIQLTSWAWWFIPWFTGFSHPRGAGFLLSTEVTVWTLWRHLNNLSQNDMVFFYQLPKNNNVYSPLNELNAKFTIKNVMYSQTKYLCGTMRMCMLTFYSLHIGVWGILNHMPYTLQRGILVAKERQDIAPGFTYIIIHPSVRCVFWFFHKSLSIRKRSQEKIVTAHKTNMEP